MRVFFVLVSGAAQVPFPNSGLGCLHLVNEHAVVADFREAVFTEVGRILAPGLLASALQVISSKDDTTQVLELDAKMAGLGATTEEPLIVQVSEVWFELVDGDIGGAVYESTSADSVPLSGENSIASLQNAVRKKAIASLPPGLRASDLKVFENRASRVPLASDAPIKFGGCSAQQALIVVVPKIWFHLVDGSNAGPAYEACSEDFVPLAKIADIRTLRKAVFEKKKNYLPLSIRASDLKLFENRDAEHPLNEDTCIGRMGSLEQHPLIVVVPKMWFQLVDGDVRGPDLDTGSENYVRLTQGTSIRTLQQSVFDMKKRTLLSGLQASDLNVFENRDAEHPLNEDTCIGRMGSLEQHPLIVVVPKMWLQLVETSASGAVTSTVSVSLPLTEDCSAKTLVDVVFANFPNTLEGVDRLEVKVYTNNAAYRDGTQNRNLMRPSDKLGSRGQTEDTALVVEVPLRRRTLRASESFVIEITAIGRGVDTEELEQYQKRGRLIREKCPTYCNQILDKVDEYYRDGVRPFPFICVEGSSGVGKTQLAFALEGRRPFVYFLAMQRGINPQRIYNNFESASAALRKCVNMDNPKDRSEADILNSVSDFYRKEKLWTYGFIRALLQYCQLKPHQDALQMLRFEDCPTLNVEKCDLKAVLAVVEAVKDLEQKLPFFVLDEMSPTDQGKKEAAFQRNAIGVCGLVVIAMGTDAGITNLFQPPRPFQLVQSIKWASIIPRFPSYQSMFHKEGQQEIWAKVVKQFPVVNDILMHARVGFGGLFMDAVVRCARRSSNIKLCELLDEAFADVKLKTHAGKPSLSSLDGWSAQVKAISFVPVAEPDVGDQRARKRPRLEVSTTSMRSHFANLVDEKLTDVRLAHGLLQADTSWTPTCGFPAVAENLLLYLSILGGKTYPSYYDHEQRKVYSTKCMFLKTNTARFSNSTPARSIDHKVFEDMVAHACFSSSRRIGVQGIALDEFLVCLLGEFHDDVWMKMTLRDGHSGEQVGVSDIFEGYADGVAGLCSRMVPFLAPPNAEWPQCILAANVLGCNFGHLARLCTHTPFSEGRRDVYIRSFEKPDEKAMLLCDCKYWNKDVNLARLRNIVHGLDDTWDGWSVVLLFCRSIVDRTQWEFDNVGCVKVKCQGSNAELSWVFQPQTGSREKLIIAVDTVAIGCTMG